MLKSFSHGIKHGWKRALAFLLAVVTVIGMLPVTAMAAGDTGGLNPGSPGGQKPNSTDVAWSTVSDLTFLRFTLVEFPNGVVTDLNTNDSGVWRVVGTPLNVIWNKAVSYRPPPPDVPEWDAVFQGVPFVLAADMDLRRLDAAIRAARAQGHRQIVMAALSGQAEQVLFPRYWDTGLARVFVLTADAIEAVTGRKPVPYTPPRTQFMTSKGDVVDAPPIQTHRKTGKPAGAKNRPLV